MWRSWLARQIVALKAGGSNPLIHPIFYVPAPRKRSVCIISPEGGHTGLSPSGKAPDFDSGIRRFKSCQPSQNDSVAQSAEHLPFKQGVRGSNPRRGTKKASPTGWLFCASRGKLGAVTPVENPFPAPPVEKCEYLLVQLEDTFLDNPA